ncbi:hypothetical protein M9Y10_004851 [Tritrichomonas musculus]|uniref:Sister chromatid cohesion protein n=1 Tax=Tritrichomonas musculus TaxID=1915356 RepID=A0ABR2JKK0_9EUKA
MSVVNLAAEANMARNRDDRPGRTRIHPAEELNSILRTYCVDDQEFGLSAIRSIGTAVTKLSDNRMLYTADQELIYNFLKIQNDSLKKQNSPLDNIEITLKILAEPDMPLMLYNNEWIQNIIDHLSNLCNDIFQKKEKRTQIPGLFSIFRHFSYIVYQINLSESSLYKLLSLSLLSYFHIAASPPLQTASCSLMTSIFKRNPSLRNDIIIEIFVAVEKNQGSPKSILFAKNIRKNISAVTILFIELLQSISSFPCDTKDITQEIIKHIIQTFLSRAKITSISKLFEKFVEDIGLLSSHPLYPISKIVLKNVLEFLFPSISKKDDNTRISIKLICIALKNIINYSQRAKENAIIVFPKSILESLVGYTDERIQEQLNNKETNIFEMEDDYCSLQLSSSFPRNAFEELTAHFIISLYINQSMRLTEVISNSLLSNITLWSTKKLSQEEIDNYLLWWKGVLPSNISFEWTLDIAEQICLHEICKMTMFSHVHFLVQHLLKGLENKNSNIRSMILRGLSSLIEINPDLLFHPSLVSQINDAFKDPSAPIRDSVLQIISKYIIQKDKSSSPYFSVVINCLTDPSPMVVKRALGIVGQLSKNSNDESLTKLSYLLSTKFNDESSTVSKAAKNALIQILFEDAQDPTQILASVLSKTHGKSSWFAQFINPLYLKKNYASAIDIMIEKSFENIKNSLTYENCCLVREFCDVFPSICANQHEIIISIINSCTDDRVLSILSSSLNSILNDITNPNVTLFTLLMQCIQKCIYTKSALIIRSVIEVGSHISAEILATNNVLTSSFEYFSNFLKNNLGISKQKEFVETAESLKLVSYICRALYIIGCLCRFHKALTQEQVSQVCEIVQCYFNASVPKIRSMVLQTVCDICVRDSSQTQKAKELVQHAFKLGPPESVSGITFLKNLIEEESKAEDSADINDFHQTFSSNLINDFMFEIKKCFSCKDSAIRSAVLEFANVALKYGAVNPSDIIPYVISMLCYSELSNLALETIKVVIYHYSTFFNNRMKDGIYEAFNCVMNIHGPGFTSLPFNDYCFHIGDLLNILQPPQKSIFLTAFTDILEEALSTNQDPFWINWIIRSLCNFPYSYTWELKTIVDNLNNNVFSTFINSTYADAKALMHSENNKSKKNLKNANACAWYASILILRAKQWLMKKYQIPKKPKNNDIDKKSPVKVAIIQPISFKNIPIPDQEKDLKDSLTNLFTQFQSTIRIERSSDLQQYE